MTSLATCLRSSLQRQAGGANGVVTVIRGVLRNMLQHAHHWPRLTRNGGVASILGRIFDVPDAP